METITTKQKLSQNAVKQILEDWESHPKEVVEKTIQKYGQPDEGTPSRLIWYNNGPWKRTIVFRDEVKHNFPKSHPDLIEQVIDYRVPLNRYNDLAQFDGSVMVERTKGEISARCDKEEMNWLALNLANDIVNGRKEVDEAREEYAKQAMAFMKKEIESAPYTQGFKFQVSKSNTADPDEEIVGMKEKMGVMASKMKNAVNE